MAKYVIKRDAGSLPEKLTRYKQELNEEQFRAVTAKPRRLACSRWCRLGKNARHHISGRLSDRTRRCTAADSASDIYEPGRGEMLRRVETLTGSQNVHRVWGGTFHRIANMMLRRHAVSIGYDQNYSILDSEDARDLLNLCIDDAAIDTKKKRFPKAEVIQDILSYATNTDMPIENVIIGKYPYFELLTAADKTLSTSFFNSESASATSWTMTTCC